MVHLVMGNGVFLRRWMDSLFGPITTIIHLTLALPSFSPQDVGIQVQVFIFVWCLPPFFVTRTRCMFWLRSSQCGGSSAVQSCPAAKSWELVRNHVMVRVSSGPVGNRRYHSDCLMFAIFSKGCQSFLCLLRQQWQTRREMENLVMGARSGQIEEEQLFPNSLLTVSCSPSPNPVCYWLFNQLIKQLGKTFFCLYVFIYFI